MIEKRDDIYLPQDLRSGNTCND